MTTKKTSELTALTTPSDSDLIAVVQSGVDYKATRQQVRGYKVYVALLTQTGTNAPVATVLENTLGGTVVWTYDSAGAYIGTLNNAFTVGKSVAFFLPLPFAPGYEFQFAFNDVNSCQLSALNGALSPANDLFDGLCLEIRVYP